MVDTVSRAKRSQIMSAVRSKNNRSTEIYFVHLLKNEKIKGWRRHYPLLGKPDFIWKKAKLAVFVDGCFWHGCTTCYRLPKSNVEFWIDKVAKNKKRDLLVSKQLRQKGWSVMRIRECLLRDGPKAARALKKIKRLIQGAK